MNEQLIKEAPRLAMKNRSAIEESETCGCYYCLNVFSKLDITEWTDWGETALCPKCKIDSVLPQTSGIPLDEEHLNEVHRFWFGPKK